MEQRKRQNVLGLRVGGGLHLNIDILRQIKTYKVSLLKNVFDRDAYEKHLVPKHGGVGVAFTPVFVHPECSVWSSGECVPVLGYVGKFFFCCCFINLALTCSLNDEIISNIFSLKS